MGDYLKIKLKNTAGILLLIVKLKTDFSRFYQIKPLN